jgi:hypothetical protein
MPSATALTSFLCFTLIAGQRLTVAKAFTSIALFSRLQEPMTALPGQVFAMLHGKYVFFIGCECRANTGLKPMSPCSA